ncbi:Swarming motility regulation protein rssB [Nocardia otitidiscaviarum]|uniref:Swarming motility regulation protein rssB n=1 Tax=Nocardia otitidiscaviarum TaxID=1823 RepID=A0A379JGD1_9NOCA|nr:fused response regulator/phosphatase [Nocardia otitidiscaviarum]SUD47592.1 Swarming motility regulation protein rssB [Nocardia otitidiscaviarum]
MRREPFESLVADRVWPQPRVLLIEDDPADALLVEELVTEGAPGCTLRWVRSLAEADPELRAGTANCVLLDLHLPDANGLEALSRVRGRTDVAVVVLTGLDEEHTGLAAVAAGAQDYLVKGRVEPELFGRAVRYAIQRKQTEHTSAALQASQMRAQENARLERGLLPTPLLPARSAVTAVPRYRPGRAHALLGGDFYDVVADADGIVHAVIGDVSGHGPDAAAAGVALRLAWRTLILSGVTGTRQLRLLEQVLLAERTAPSTFATATSLELRPDDGTVRVLRAGHPGMLLRCGDEVSWLETPGGPALGFLPGRADWPEHTVALPADCGLALLTDGLFEGCVNEHGDRLGEDGLLDLARRIRADSPDAFLDALIGQVESLAAASGGLDDDVAMLYLHWADDRENRD